MMGPIFIDPATMLTLVVDAPEGQRTVHVVQCRYVVARVEGTQRRAVAVEIIYDSRPQRPAEAYLCEVAHLRTEVLATDALKRVSPYRLPVQSTSDEAPVSQG